jgi:hypothetical protein
MKRWQFGSLAVLIASVMMFVFTARIPAQADLQQTNRGILGGLPKSSRPAGLAVCPDPSAPCDSRARKFAAFELPFRLPATLRRGMTYKSAPFYAAIVKTYAEEACDADDHTVSIEQERLQIQKDYPTKKVFGYYSCPNMDAVDYDFPGKLDPSGERVLLTTYLAVYAGATELEAETFLAELKKRFPDAMLKRMTAAYEVIDQ